MVAEHIVTVTMEAVCKIQFTEKFSHKMVSLQYKQQQYLVSTTAIGLYHI